MRKEELLKDIQFNYSIQVLENNKLYVELTKVMENPDVPIKIALESRATNFSCWPIREEKWTA
jgi:hypothetical protein